MNNRLNILWTNDNETTAELMVFMYAVNSLNWELWDEVRIIIWGATAKLVAENTKIQKLIIDAKTAGVKFSVCESCAEKLGVKDKIEELNLELKLWGKPLTEIIKNLEVLLIYLVKTIADKIQETIRLKSHHHQWLL